MGEFNISFDSDEIQGIAFRLVRDLFSELKDCVEGIDHINKAEFIEILDEKIEVANQEIAVLEAKNLLK